MYITSESVTPLVFQRKNLTCYICDRNNKIVCHDMLFPVWIRIKETNDYIEVYVCSHHLEDPEESLI